MAFDGLPLIIQETIPSVKKYIGDLGYRRIKEEVPPPFAKSYPWTPTLTANTPLGRATFDVRDVMRFEPQLFKNYVQYCQINRIEVEIWLVVVSDSDDFSYFHTFLKEMKINGVGLMVVSPTHKDIVIKAIPMSVKHNFSNEEVDVKYYGAKTRRARDRFTDGDWLDAFKEQILIFEQAVTDVLKTADKKGVVCLSKKIAKMQLHESIDLLGDPNKSLPQGSPVLIERNRLDCLSYKNGRNLASHPRTSLEEERILYRAVLEKMMMGFRLIQELVAIRDSL